MESARTVIGACPLCGADVIKTSKGWRCANFTRENPSCGFIIPAVVCNRRLLDDEATRLLHGESLMLDGFCSNELKQFASVLSLDKTGQTQVNARVGTCPRCGGEIFVGLRGFNCSNYRSPDNPCKFTVWRYYGTHEVSLGEIKEILTTGITSRPVKMYNDVGDIYEKRLGIAPDFESIIKF